MKPSAIHVRFYRMSIAVPAERSFSHPRRYVIGRWNMTSTKWKLATAFGLAGAIALSVPSAEARDGRNAAIGFGIAAGALALGAAAASSPYYYGGGPYAYYNDGPYAYSGAYAYERPYVYDSYNSYDYVAPAPYYYGRTYRRSGQTGPGNYDRNSN